MTFSHQLIGNFSLEVTSSRVISLLQSRSKSAEIRQRGHSASIARLRSASSAARSAATTSGPRIRSSKPSDVELVIDASGRSRSAQLPKPAPKRTLGSLAAATSPKASRQRCSRSSARLTSPVAANSNARMDRSARTNCAMKGSTDDPHSQHQISKESRSSPNGHCRLRSSCSIGEDITTASQTASRFACWDWTLTVDEKVQRNTFPHPTRGRPRE